MNKLHVVTGLLTLGVFLLSGVYMLLELNLPQQDMGTQRMMYRASHIYLLFIGCLNVVVGMYIEKVTADQLLNLQRFSSLCLVAAQPALILAFLLEPAAIDHDRFATLIHGNRDGAENAMQQWVDVIGFQCRT